MSDVFTTRDAGPAVEREIASDMVRRALPAAPVIVVLAARPRRSGFGGWEL